MMNAPRAISFIRLLTGLTLVLSGLPVLWMLAMFVVALVVNPTGGIQLIMDMPLLALQLVFAAVIIIQTAARMIGWGHAARVLVISGVAEAALTIALLFLADDALEQGILWLSAAAAAVLLTLNSLWSWLAKRIPTDCPEAAEQNTPTRRHPFGPRPTTWRGWVVRWAQCGLLMLCVMAILPAALWSLIIILALFSGVGQMEPSDWLIHGTVLLCFASLALTILRLDGRWWSPWVFLGVVAAFAALMAAEVWLIGDANNNLFVWVPVAVAAAQALLHTVRSMGTEREETEAAVAVKAEEDTKV